MVELARRSFLTGLGALLVAAPAIVRATSIMPVKVTIINPYAEFGVDEIHALLAKRIKAAEVEMIRIWRPRLEAMVYREGTGASDGGLAALFNG